MWNCKHGVTVPFFNQPFMVTGHGVMECHHGPDRNEMKKKKRVEDMPKTVFIATSILKFIVN